MKIFVSFFVLMLLFPLPLKAADTHYEVYYFHASWRCANCTNAEAWAGEAITALQKANPDVEIVYAPKQLEKNKALAAQTQAERVDLAVAEIKNGKTLRSENLGNLLGVVGSKPLLLQTAIDGVLAFDAKRKDGGRLKKPAELDNFGESVYHEQ